MDDEPEDDRLFGGVRRAVDGAFDATVGRVGQSVGEVAMDVTGATAQQVIEDLEPYLIEEAIPKIVDGLTPYLTDTVVPEVLEGVTDHLVADTVPNIVDGVTAHLVAVTIPEVVDGITPRLVADLLPAMLEDLRPYLEAELVPKVVEGLLPYISQSVGPELLDALMPKIQDEIAPQLLDALMPQIEQQIAPQLVDALMPKIQDEVAPQLLDALMPQIEQQIAPQLVDALMPKIQDEIAPQLVDGLMPKIRKEVVPTIMDDIVDDPAVRDLIREQSQGLFLDALEGFRTTLANADTLVERAVRGVLRQPARVMPESGLELVLEEGSDADSKPVRVEVEDLAARRAAWRDLPIDPPPPGRSFTYGGVVTRLLALTIDIGGVGYLTSQVLTTTVNLLESLFGELSTGFTAFLYLVAAYVVPIYLGLCYWGLGRTFGMAVVGLKVCTPDGRRPGFIRAMLRAWIGLLGIVIWFLTGFGVFFDAKRRTLLDRLAHTEVRYSVPETQQRRHIRDAIEERRGQAGKLARQEERDRANAQALLELDEQAAGGPADGPAPVGDLDGS